MNLISVVAGIPWKETGNTGAHSRAVGICLVDTTPRWETNISHKINIKYNKETKDIVDPIEDNTCHFINTSG